MLSDKHFTDCFTASGGWFFLANYEIVKNWRGSTSDLVDRLFHEGFDSKRSGTNTRVSSMLRIIEHNMDRQALEKIRDSATINRHHPEAEALSKKLIAKYSL